MRARCIRGCFFPCLGVLFVIANAAFFLVQNGEGSSKSPPPTECNCPTAVKTSSESTKPTLPKVAQIPREEIPREEIPEIPFRKVKQLTKPFKKFKPLFRDAVTPRVYKDGITDPTIPPVQMQPSFSFEPNSKGHKLAVVVPFRNRYEEMMEFAPHIHGFLTRQNISHHIWVINQVDNHRFNRASLLNIGFILARRAGCDYLVMHDIDLLPLNDKLLYKFPDDGPLHISGPELHPRYHYKTFVGGILIISREQFEKLNGMSNIFWGWGMEDDELYARMQDAKMEVQRPQGIRTGYNTFKHNHDDQVRPRDRKRYKAQWDMAYVRDHDTGLDTVEYEVAKSTEMSINGAAVTFVSVKLVCDYKITPYCDNTG